MNRLTGKEESLEKLRFSIITCQLMFTINLFTNVIAYRELNETQLFCYSCVNALYSHKSVTMLYSPFETLKNTNLSSAKSPQTQEPAPPYDVMSPHQNKSHVRSLLSIITKVHRNLHTINIKVNIKVFHIY